MRLNRRTRGELVGGLGARKCPIYYVPAQVEKRNLINWGTLKQLIKVCCVRGRLKMVYYGPCWIDIIIYQAARTRGLKWVYCEPFELMVDSDDDDDDEEQ